MTFGALFDLYLKSYAMLHCKRWRDFVRSYELYLSQWSDRDIATIKRADIIQLQGQLAQERCQSAANRAVELISMVYNKALDWELYEGKNPANRIRKFRIKPRKRFLQPDELPKFFAAVAKLRNPTTRDFFLVLLFTAQRRRKVAEMRWEDIRWQRQTWEQKDTKNGDDLEVPLIAEAQIILQRRFNDPRRHPIWVFPKQDGSGPIWCRSTAWKKLLEHAGLSDLRMHDLRRTLASYQAIRGVNLSIIGQTLGHRDIKSTQIYACLNLDPVREAMEEAAKAMIS